MSSQSERTSAHGGPYTIREYPTTESGSALQPATERPGIALREQEDGSFAQRTFSHQRQGPGTSHRSAYVVEEHPASSSPQGPGAGGMGEGADPSMNRSQAYVRQAGGGPQRHGGLVITETPPMQTQPGNVAPYEQQRVEYATAYPYMHQAQPHPHQHHFVPGHYVHYVPRHTPGHQWGPAAPHESQYYGLPPHLQQSDVPPQYIPYGGQHGQHGQHVQHGQPKPQTRSNGNGQLHHPPSEASYHMHPRGAPAEALTDPRFGIQPPAARSEPKDIDPRLVAAVHAAEFRPSFLQQQDPQPQIPASDDMILRHETRPGPGRRQQSWPAGSGAAGGYEGDGYYDYNSGFDPGYTSEDERNMEEIDSAVEDLLESQEKTLLLEEHELNDEDAKIMEKLEESLEQEGLL